VQGFKSPPKEGKCKSLNHRKGRKVEEFKSPPKEGKCKSLNLVSKHKNNGNKILVEYFGGEYEVETGENLNRE